MDETIGQAWYELGLRNEGLDRGLTAAEGKIRASGKVAADAFARPMDQAAGRVRESLGKVANALNSLSGRGADALAADLTQAANAAEEAHRALRQLASTKDLDPAKARAYADALDEIGIEAQQTLAELRQLQAADPHLNTPELARAANEIDRVGREARDSAAGLNAMKGVRADTHLEAVSNQAREAAVNLDRTGQRSGALSEKFMKLRGAMAAVGIAVGISTAIGFINGAVTAASDLNETIAKTSVILGRESLPELEEWAEGMAAGFGQSKREALDAASTFAIFGKSAGLAGAELATFSKDLAELGGDLSSFFGGTPEEAIQAIGAALRGESEPIRRYGVLLDEATLRQRALKLGIIETITQALTPQQRVLAAQAEIFAQTADAQGDYARTSGDLAQQGKTLRANLENLNAEIGEKLLPLMVKLATFANDELVPALQNLANAIEPVAGLLGTLFGTEAPQSWEDIARIALETGRRIPYDASTALRYGTPGLRAAAGDVFSGIPAEAETARVKAVAIARMIPRDVAKAIIAGQRDVESGVALLTELMNDEWTDAARLAYFKGVLASEQLAAGMASEDADVRSTAIDITNNALREVGRLESGFYDAGARQGQNVGTGLSSAIPAVTTAAGGIAGTARSNLAFDATQIGANVTTSFAAGLVSLAAIQAALDAATYVKKRVSGVLEFAGSPPYTESRRIGEMVAKTWGEGVARGLGQLSASGALAALGGPSVVAAGAGGMGAGQATAPMAAPGSGSTTFHLHFAGRESVVESAYEAIDEVTRLGVFSDGRTF